MPPSRIYDYLVLARGKLLDKVRALSPEQYAQQFAIGLGSLARTLTHTLISEWYYVQRIRRREVPPYEQWPIRDESPPAFSTLESEWAKQADDTRAAIREIDDWDAPLEYRVTADDGRRMIVTASPAEIFAQLAFHEVHHRAQAMSMLRQLGSPIGEDLDFNTLMYGRREATEASPPGQPTG
jgi:uncharacterized damage-inducible protein DinB